MYTAPAASRRLLIAIWILFLVKGLFYCVLFPLWEGFDEYSHFAFIQFVATHHELPTPATVDSQEVDRSLRLVPLPSLLRQSLGSGTSHDEYWQLSARERAARTEAMFALPAASQTELGDGVMYEAQQAPLYYWLMAPLHWAMRSQSLPVRVFVLRLINILLVSAIIPIAFLSARMFFRDDYAALAVCALLAAMPELYIDAARVGNQTIATVLYGLLTLLCLRALNGKPQYLMIGATLGLLLLSKAYALAAIPGVCFVLVWIIWRSEKPFRSATRAAASMACSAVVAGWWYVRNLELTGSLVWISSTPVRPARMADFAHYILQIDWKSAVRSLAGSHLWFGNWSFLSVRSWMYEVLEFFVLALIAGVAVMAVRSLRSARGTIPLQHLVLAALVFGGFLAALGYHILVSFINSNVAATCGWYLYAVAVPEGLLAVTGVMAFGRWKRRLLLVIVGSFSALELYATHWLLIPYYTGLTRRAPSGALASFYPGRMSMSFAELLSRMHVNRPPFVTSSVVFVLWVLYVVSIAGLYMITFRSSRSTHSQVQESANVTVAVTRF
jgi:hypothetical protein